MCAGGWSNVPRDRGLHQRGKSDADDTQRARAVLITRGAPCETARRGDYGLLRNICFSRKNGPRRREARRVGRVGQGDKEEPASENGINREYREYMRRVASRRVASHGVAFEKLCLRTCCAFRTLNRNAYQFLLLMPKVDGRPSRASSLAMDPFFSSFLTY